MGSAASTSPPESIDHHGITKLDPLITRKRLFDVAKLISSDPRAQTAFCTYVKGGEWGSHVNIHLLKKLLIENSHFIPQENVTFSINDYKFPPGTASLLNRYLGNRTQRHFNNAMLMRAGGRNALSETDAVSIRSLLISSVFPWFIISKEYKALEESDASFTGKSVTDLLYKNKEDSISPAAESTMGSEADAASGEQVWEMDRLVDNLFLDILSKKTWMDHVNTIIDNFSLCVSISTADPRRKGFPLIYVNKTFLTTTGYTAEEVLGQNCRFLQCMRTEEDQVKKLRNALRNAEPIKLGITNVRKDGTEFFNMLALRPVFDLNGNYTHVVGVQYDITQATSSSADVQRVDDLLHILPNLML